MEKKIMQAYIDGLNAHDYEGIGALYAEEGTFSDGATRLLNLPDGSGTGPAGVAEFFKGIMGQFDVSADLIKMNDRSMEYDVHLGPEITLPCVGTVTLDADGKIIEYLARPR